jgi:excisionase family DNA binding protein
MERKHILLNIQQAADYLGIKVSTLYQWVSQKRIAYHKSGRLVKFDLSDLDKFIEKSKVKPVKEIYEY